MGFRGVVNLLDMESFVGMTDGQYPQLSPRPSYPLEASLPRRVSVHATPS